VSGPDIAVHHDDSLAFLVGEYPDEVQAMVSSTGPHRDGGPCHVAVAISQRDDCHDAL